MAKLSPGETVLDLGSSGSGGSRHIQIGAKPATGIATTIVTGNLSNPLEAAIVAPTLGSTMSNDPSFFLDLTGGSMNNYGHEPDQQLLDGASGLPTSSDCNSSTTTENELPILPIGQEGDQTVSFAALEVNYGKVAGE